MDPIRPGGIRGLKHPTVHSLRTWLGRLDNALFTLGILVYGLTRLVALEHFPIYFFCDEAILVVRAEELLQNGLRSAEGRLLPTFMANADRWNLGLPVYIHLTGLALLGKSVAVTRAVSAVVSLLGALAVAGILKWVFKTRLWWAGVLVMAVMPAWLLHSRTAFDPVMMAAFYACFLLAYLLYRCHSPRYLYAVPVFAAAASYSYPNGQAVILASAVLLLLSDLRYHLRQPPRHLLGVSLVSAILVLPLARFLIEQPGAWEGQLQVINAYVVQPLPVVEKLRIFFSLYAQGLDPRYWFFPNEVDWVRHRWAGLGHLGQYLLPFVMVGLGVSLRRWRCAAHRAVLIAILAAPVGAALYRIEVTRAIAMVIPAALLAVLGLQQTYEWLQRWFQTAYEPFAIRMAGLFSLTALTLLGVALVTGPTWFRDYGLYGMQYGARQVFAEVQHELASSPERRMLITHTWANFPNAFIPFFLDPNEQARVEMISIEPFMVERREIREGWMFVMTAPEYTQATDSGKFDLAAPKKTLFYPNGEPAFYFVSLRYSPAADAIFAREQVERLRLVEASAVIDGQLVTARHSQIDLGEIADLFDGSTDTIIRGRDANPLVLEFDFPEPRPVSAITLDGWSPNIDLHVSISPPGDDPPDTFAFQYRSPSVDPQVRAEIPGGARLARRLRLEIWNAGEGPIAKVHLRELQLHP